ncbi:MAG: pentapeptide repeat-containing protein [Nitrospirales bacterium]|nr:pentapeptide repeat-containing protein [Nitrospirales bacterium]
MTCPVTGRQPRMRLPPAFHAFGLCLVGMAFALFGFNVPNLSACEIQKSSKDSQIFQRHLIGPCSVDDRRRVAVSAESLLQALQDGKSLDLRGIVVEGDLMLDRLPLESLPHALQGSPRVRRIVDERHVETGRVISGSITMQDVVVQGNWATNLRNGLLVLFGPFAVTGTRFEQSIDHSHTLFLQAFDFSDSVIRYEGFFVGAYFDQSARFSKTTFGTHSRFHQAQFAQVANFMESRFHGLAEFLEVVFSQQANFSGVQFQMGTGFSGTHFNGPALFSRARFQREVFFRFARFRRQANFAGTTFEAVSDFSEASFSGTPDFSRAKFHTAPELSHANLDEQVFAASKFKQLSGKLVFLFTFLGICCVVAWGVQKWRKTW